MTEKEFKYRFIRTLIRESKMNEILEKNSVDKLMHDILDRLIDDNWILHRDSPDAMTPEELAQGAIIEWGGD